MGKSAIFVKGEPTIRDDPRAFYNFQKNGINIMSNLALLGGYAVQASKLNKLMKKIMSCTDSDKFLFYYSGHFSRGYLDSKDYPLNNFLGEMEKISGNKIIILDSFAGDYFEGDFDLLEQPKNSKIIGVKSNFEYKNNLTNVLNEILISEDNLEGITIDDFLASGLKEIHFSLR